MCLRLAISWTGMLPQWSAGNPAGKRAGSPALRQAPACLRGGQPQLALPLHCSPGRRPPLLARPGPALAGLPPRPWSGSSGHWCTPVCLWLCCSPAPPAGLASPLPAERSENPYNPDVLTSTSVSPSHPSAAGKHLARSQCSARASLECRSSRRCHPRAPGDRGPAPPAWRHRGAPPARGSTPRPPRPGGCRRRPHAVVRACRRPGSARGAPGRRAGGWRGRRRAAGAGRGGRAGAGGRGIGAGEAGRRGERGCSRAQMRLEGGGGRGEGEAGEERGSRTPALVCLGLKLCTPFFLHFSGHPRDNAPPSHQPGWLE